MTNQHLVPMNNKKVSGRELRRKLNADSAWMGTQVAPAINQLLRNEQVTQRRIMALEADVDAFHALTFWQRLRWLCVGTPNLVPLTPPKEL